MLKKRRDKRKRLKQILSSYILPNGTRKETKIESLFRQYLIDLEISFKFIQEKPLTYGKKGRRKKYDFYLWDENEYGDKLWHLLIEVNGSFWHGKDYYNGSKPFSKLKAIQKRNIKNDSFKRKLAIKNQIPILTFWEDEINSKEKWIKEKLLYVIEKCQTGLTEITEDIFPIYDYKIPVKRKKLSV